MSRLHSLCEDARTLTSILVISLAVTACNASRDPADAPSEVTSRPTTSRPEPPEVAEHLDAAPGTCPGPDLKRGKVSPFYGPLVGDRLAHAGLYARYEAPDGFHAPDAPRTRFGFRIKALWVMNARQMTTVTVSGHAGPGIDLWFEVAEDGGRPSTELVLDPASIGTSFEHPRWKEFHTYLYFPTAECFHLEVTGKGGGWTAAVGLGT
jgi:hypothetical protein